MNSNLILKAFAPFLMLGFWALLLFGLGFWPFFISLIAAILIGV